MFQKREKKMFTRGEKTFTTWPETLSLKIKDPSIVVDDPRKAGNPAL